MQTVSDHTKIFSKYHEVVEDSAVENTSNSHEVCCTLIPKIVIQYASHDWSHKVAKIKHTVEKGGRHIADLYRIVDLVIF